MNKQQKCDKCKQEFDTDGWCQCDHEKLAAGMDQQPQPVAEVPDWCRDATMECRDATHASLDRVHQFAAIIARHAPKQSDSLTFEQLQSHVPQNAGFTVAQQNGVAILIHDESGAELYGPTWAQVKFALAVTHHAPKADVAESCFAEVELLDHEETVWLNTRSYNQVIKVVRKYDHDKIVAELREQISLAGEIDQETIDEWSKRAEAAEAEVERFANELHTQMQTAYMRLDYVTASRIANLIGADDPVENELADLKEPERKVEWDIWDT